VDGGGIKEPLETALEGCDVLGIPCCGTLSGTLKVLFFPTEESELCEGVLTELD
jgi:hypothetical protein